MYQYEIKQIPGSQRRGIFVDGMLLAKIEDRRMEQEAERLVKMARMFIQGDHLRPPPPIVIDMPEGDAKTFIESLVVKRRDPTNPEPS